MKAQSRNIVTWIAAAVCLALAPGATARDDTTIPKTSTTQETRTETGTPAKCDKASGIIGMDVRNQNDEHLGHIKDLVIDWNKDQVSYAVLSTGTKALLDVNQKLLAVPLSAFTASADHKYLVLNADKAKVEAAAGFDKNNWPSASNPSWGAEPFWQTDTTRPGSHMRHNTTPGTTTPPAPGTDQDMNPGTK